MTAMKVKIADLVGRPLDWAVAQCEGLPIARDPMGFGVNSVEGGYWVWPEFSSGKQYRKIGRDYSPSTRWADGGPLIEKYAVTLNENGPGNWWSHCGNHLGEGAKPLTAAMRAIVAAKLGDEVEVPAELVEGKP